MNNPYSKYRYTNNFNIKARTSSNGKVTSAFGAGLCSTVNNAGAKMVGETMPAYGTTMVVNHVYKVERLNNVDNPITPSSYIGPTFFKLFKL